MARPRMHHSCSDDETERGAVIRIVEVWWLLHGAILWLIRSMTRVWKMNPVSFLRHRMRKMYKLDNGSDLPIKPGWTGRIRDLFTSEMKRKVRLLDWVRTQVTYVSVDDFTYSWQDGICLCALLESICPGVCPRYHLLKTDLRVNNCKYGLLVAHAYLAIQCTVITPEELAIADMHSEMKIVQLVQMLRWKQSSVPKSADAVRTVAIPIRRIVSRCFARGTGLKSAVVGRQATFNIITDGNGFFDLLVEIDGPNGEHHSEKITSSESGQLSSDPRTVHAPEGKSKPTGDQQRVRFTRLSRSSEDVNDDISFDYQIVSEGRFLVSYIPLHPGAYAVAIKSHDHHIQGSPFEVSVSDWTSPWNSVNRSKYSPDRLPLIHEGKARDRQLTDAACSVFLKAGKYVSRRQKRNPSQLTVSRRVLKKYITRQGEEIVVSDYSPPPTLSRQSSIDISDLSEEDGRKKETHASDPKSSTPSADDVSHRKLIKEDVAFPDSETSVESDSLSVWSVDKSNSEKSPKMLARKLNTTKPNESASSSDCPSSSMSTDFTMSSISSDHAMMLTNLYLPRSKDDSRNCRFPIHRSMSDSMTMSLEVIDPGSGVNNMPDLETVEATKNEMSGITLLRSFKSLCLSMGDTIDRPDTSSHTNSRQSSGSVIIRPRPSLLQLHKMNRKWQSVDTEDISQELEDVGLSSSHSLISKDVEPHKIINNKSNAVNKMGSEHDLKGENKNEKDSFIVLPTDLKPTSNVTPCLTLFNKSTCSQVQHVNVATVSPSAHCDKTTQVSNEEIKQETNWHPRASTVQKTMTCVQVGNVLVNPDNGRMPHHEVVIPLENRHTVRFHELLKDIDQKTRNVCNVTEWLNRNKGRTTNTLKSSVDTILIGSSFELEFNESNTKRHQWRRHLHPSINENIAFSAMNSSFPELNAKRNSIVSDSEIDYGPNSTTRPSKPTDKQSGQTTPPTTTTTTQESEKNTPGYIFRNAESKDEHLNTNDSLKDNTNCIDISKAITSKRHVSFQDSTTDSVARSPNATGVKAHVIDSLIQSANVTGCKDVSENGHAFSLLLQDNDDRDLLKHATADITGRDTRVASLSSRSAPSLHSETGDITQLCQDALFDDFKQDFVPELDDLWPPRLPEDLHQDDDCAAFGLGLTHGYVGIKNNFQVWARQPSVGNVSISICGPKPHCVTETSTIYTGDSLYEVTYEVTLPGSYVISVKWCDQNVANSPFIAYIVFD